MERSHKKQKGFTLVELSIVLVIIGLIVGGVLVGQDLIAAARIRAMVSQIEKIDAGAAAFQAKYGGRAGDLLEARASAFGLTTNTGVGDGNGVIEDGQTTNTNTFADEIADYFDHLTDAALIQGVATDATPATALGKGFWTVGSYQSDLASPGSLLFYVTVTASAGVNAADLMTPAEAFGFDNKIDDGLPLTGQTLAVDDTTITGATGITTVTTSPSTGDCNDTTGGLDYDLSSESNACAIAARAQS